jgi:hypothetical protein
MPRPRRVHDGRVTRTRNEDPATVETREPPEQATELPLNFAIDVVQRQTADGRTAHDVVQCRAGELLVLAKETAESVLGGSTPRIVAQLGIQLAVEVCTEGGDLRRRFGWRSARGV